MRNITYHRIIDVINYLSKKCFWLIIVAASTYTVNQFFIYLYDLITRMIYQDPIPLTDYFPSYVSWSIMFIFVLVFLLFILTVKTAKDKYFYSDKKIKYRYFWMAFGYEVQVRGGNDSDKKLWLEENMRSLYQQSIRHEHTYVFLSGKDAMAFKLKWVD